LGVQLLDGVGAGIWGAITPLVLADLMRGTGRYNVAQGGVMTAQGIGASLSGLAAGVIVDHFGYSPAFLTSAMAAALAFVALALAMPETRGDAAAAPSPQTPANLGQGVRQARPGE
jgi:MFS family permease